MEILVSQNKEFWTHLYRREDDDIFWDMEWLLSVYFTLKCETVYSDQLSELKQIYKFSKVVFLIVFNLIWPTKQLLAIQYHDAIGPHTVVTWLFFPIEITNGRIKLLFIWIGHRSGAKLAACMTEKFLSVCNLKPH